MYPSAAFTLLAAPSTPAEVIDSVAERTEQGERVSLDEVKQMIASLKSSPGDFIEQGVSASCAMLAADDDEAHARRLDLLEPRVARQRQRKGVRLGGLLSPAILHRGQSQDHVAIANASRCDSSRRGGVRRAAC